MLLLTLPALGQSQPADTHPNADDAVRVHIVYPGLDATSPLDLDGDHRIDRGDQRAFAHAYGSSAGDDRYLAAADWDGDGFIGPQDRHAFHDAFVGWRGTDLQQRYDGGTVLPVANAGKAAPLFQTPKVLARAVSEPAGFEHRIIWRIDGRPAGSGAVLAAAVAEPGGHRITAHIAGAEADDRDIITYRVAVYDPTRRRLFEPARDQLREGVDYALEAMTQPPGYASHVRWHAVTKYGTAAYGATEGARFDVRFASTFGAVDRAQRVVVQADSFVIDQNVQAAGRFPASLAHELFDAYGKLAATVDAGADAADGGRTALTHIRDQLLPVYYKVLDFELGANGLQAFTPFRDNSETEVLAIIDQLLATRSDAELQQIIYVDSELRLLPADFAFDAGLAERIDAETDSEGFLVSSSWVLKWLWNRGQSVLGCLAQGPAKIIVKLIGALHGAIHDGALDAIAAAPATVPAAKLAIGEIATGKMVTAVPTAEQQEAHATLDELVKLSTTIVGAQNAVGGGRQIVRQVRRQSLPFIDGVLRAALASAGQDQLKPFLDRGTGDANVQLDALLRLPDDQLNALVFADIALVPAAKSILAAEAGIRSLIDSMPAAATGSATKSAMPGPSSLMVKAAGDFDPVGWLWDTAVGLIGCIPNIGALLEKLVGLVHDVAHAPTPTPVPTEPVLIASTAFEDLVSTILVLDGDSQRGRSLALHVRDKTLPAVYDVISAEVVDMGEPHLEGSAALGVAAQQARMTALLDRSDASLNAGLYDAKGAVRAYAETYAEVFGVSTTPTGLEARAGGGNVWNDLMRFIKCLSEGSSTSVAAGIAGIDATAPAVPTRGDDGGGSDKLIWVIEQIHSFLH